MLNIFRRILRATPQRRPSVGDSVWWAPKGVGGTVTEVTKEGFTFQGGEIVRNKAGREVPRWTVIAEFGSTEWNGEVGMWIVGQGPSPRLTRGIVILPDPQVLSGSSTGSFAAKTGGA